MNAPSMLALAGLIVAIMALYVLSFGPLAILHEKGSMDEELFAGLYLPLFIVGEHCEPLGVCLYKYCVWLGIEDIQAASP